MNKQSLGAALAAALVLSACQGATSNPQTATPTPVSPLIGTWKGTASVNGGGSNGLFTGAIDETWTFTQTSYSVEQKEVDTPAAGGATTTTYRSKKGTYTFTADDHALTETASRSSSTPFTDTTSGWSNGSSPTTNESPYVVDGSNLYGLGGALVMKASGTTNGLLGTWSQEISGSSPGLGVNYLTWRFTFTDTSATMEAFAGPTYPGTSNGSSTFAYQTSPGSNLLNFTGQPSGLPSSLPYEIIGNHLLLASPAYVKQ